MLLRTRTLFALSVATLAALAATLVHADNKPAITKPSFDPAARKVDMFQAMEEGLIDVKLIQKNSKVGNLLIENKAKEPLTVQLPDAFVGVHVLNQIGGLGGGGLGGGGLGGGQQGGGGGQSTGGGAGVGLGGGGLGGGGLGGGGGGGFFSVPPEKLVRLPVRSVCLEHGKPEPSSRMEYKVYPVEKVSQDPVLKELLAFVAAGRVSENVGQAAAWHVANGKSWRELAAMQYQRAGGLPNPPQFNLAELQQAEALVGAATQRAKDKEEARKNGTDSPAPVSAPVRAGGARP